MPTQRNPAKRSAYFWLMFTLWFLLVVGLLLLVLGVVTDTQALRPPMAAV